MDAQFLQDSVLGIPLVGVVLGLVNFASGIGLTGRWKLVFSMITGLVIGFWYHQAQKPAQTSFEWFSYVFYGLALGLTASGLWDAAKAVVRKAVNG